MKDVVINAKFKYRYKKGFSQYIYIISLWGEQELEVSARELKAQIQAGNIKVDGLELKNNKLVPVEKEYYLINAKEDAVQAEYVSSLIEGLVLGEDLVIGNRNYASGTVLSEKDIEFLKHEFAPTEKIYIKNNLGIRNYIAKDDILCHQLAQLYKYICDKLLKQQKYTKRGSDFVQFIYKQYLDQNIFEKDKNFLYQMYLLYKYHTYTFEHSCSVAIYSTLIGLELGLNRTYIDDLFIGGLLHDIGKRKIPITLLDKNGKLDEEEFGIIMSHVYVGYTIVSSLVGFKSPIFNEYSNVERMQILTQGVMAHHAKLDGTGYPEGYSKEYITTQIITVADIFDAMTSSRAYKTPFSNNEAYKMLQEDVMRGKLNVDCVKALSNVINMNYKKQVVGYTMFKNIDSVNDSFYVKDIYELANEG